MVAKRKSLQTSVIVVKTPRKCNQTTWQTTPGCTQFDAFLLVPIDAGLDYTCVWAVLSICEAGMTASVTSVRAASLIHGTHESLLVMVAQLSLAISKQVRNQLAKVVPNDSSRRDEINEYLKLRQLFLTKKLWIFRPPFFLIASGGNFHFH